MGDSFSSGKRLASVGGDCMAGMKPAGEACLEIPPQQRGTGLGPSACTTGQPCGCSEPETPCL